MISVLHFLNPVTWCLNTVETISWTSEKWNVKVFSSFARELTGRGRRCAEPKYIARILRRSSRLTHHATETCFVHVSLCEPSFKCSQGRRIADPSWRAVLSVGFRPHTCWDCDFESRRGHGCLSWVSCVVRYRSQRRADHSFRGGWVWSRNLIEEAKSHWDCRAVRQKKFRKS